MKLQIRSLNSADRGTRVWLYLQNVPSIWPIENKFEHGGGIRASTPPENPGSGHHPDLRKRTATVTVANIAGWLQNSHSSYLPLNMPPCLGGHPFSRSVPNCPLRSSIHSMKPKARIACLRLSEACHTRETDTAPSSNRNIEE